MSVRRTNYNPVPTIPTDAQVLAAGPNARWYVVTVGREVGIFQDS